MADDKDGGLGRRGFTKTAGSLLVGAGILSDVSRVEAQDSEGASIDEPPTTIVPGMTHDLSGSVTGNFGSVNIYVRDEEGVNVRSEVSG